MGYAVSNGKELYNFSTLKKNSFLSQTLHPSGNICHSRIQADCTVTKLLHYRAYTSSCPCSKECTPHPTGSHICNSMPGSQSDSLLFLTAWPALVRLAFPSSQGMLSLPVGAAAVCLCGRGLVESVLSISLLSELVNSSRVCPLMQCEFASHLSSPLRPALAQLRHAQQAPWVAVGILRCNSPLVPMCPT